jgi:hypothetical protein
MENCNICNDLPGLIRESFPMEERIIEYGNQLGEISKLERKKLPKNLKSNKKGPSVSRLLDSKKGPYVYIIRISEKDN